MSFPSVKLADLPIDWKRGAGLKRSDIVEGGNTDCILYGELFTKHKRVLIDHGQLSKTNSAGKVVSKKGDVLIPGTSTASKHEMILAREVDTDDILLGGDINILRSKEGTFAQKYLPYYFETLSAYKQLEKYITGSTGIIHISNSGIKKLEIPLPALEEQERIVTKIEELFSEIDAADGLLQRSKNETAFYKRLKKSQLIVNKDLSNRPLSEIVNRIQIGPFGSQLHKHDYIENGIPLINPANITNGNIVANFKKSITREKYLELPMYHLAEGDIILGRRGEMGRSALVTKAEDGWFCGTGSVFMRPDINKIRPAYLAEFLSTEYAISYLENEAGGTTMNNLNKKILSNFPVPLPSIEKQDEILLEIIALKTEISTMNKVISSSMKNSKLLKQTILSKAFKGELI